MVAGHMAMWPCVGVAGGRSVVWSGWKSCPICFMIKYLNSPGA